MINLQQDPIKKTETLKVLYDGECPMCRIEISHIKKLAQKTPESNLSFIDVSLNSSESAPYVTDKSKLLARFHVERIDGTRIDGAKAFVAMWQRLPGWRFLANLSRLPGMLTIMEFSYAGFLKIRPYIQSMLRYWSK
jgi:predicted DCC family thiol-disulfide oxidoreductase YuxK